MGKGGLYSGMSFIYKYKTLCGFIKAISGGCFVLINKWRYPQSAFTHNDCPVKFCFRLNIQSCKKNKTCQDLQTKLNDNYKLVAELSAENLKLSNEKLRMEQLVDEVRHDQALLKGELHKAQSVVEAINSASPRLPGRRGQPYLNRPRHLNLNGWF